MFKAHCVLLCAMRRYKYFLIFSHLSSASFSLFVATRGKREAEFIKLKEAREAAESRVAQLLGEVAEVKTTLSIIQKGKEDGKEGEFEAMGNLKLDLEKLQKENISLKSDNAQLHQRMTSSFEEFNKSNM